LIAVSRRTVAQSNEAYQLAGDRGDDDIGWLAGPDQLAISSAQPKLRVPGDLADRPGLAFLPQQQLAAEPRGKR
jgi:hypothetical protein